MILMVRKMMNIMNTYTHTLEYIETKEAISLSPK